MRWERVNKPSDIVKIGDIVKVKVTEIDEKGRVNASIKELLEKPENYEEPIKDYNRKMLFGKSSTGKPAGAKKKQ